jgi:hypothetical protein
MLAALFFAVGCGSGDFPVAPVSGRVLCDGQPVPHAIVFFEPLQTGESALAGKQGTARAKEDGTFVISTYGTEDGAVVGKHRVRVAPPDVDEYPQFSCPCSLNSEVDVMEVEVKAGEDNKFEVKLVKSTAKAKPDISSIR